MSNKYWHLMEEFGSPSKDGLDDRRIEQCCLRWGVHAMFDVDMLLHGKPGKVTNDTSRTFMLRFSDGWHVAAFGGLNGAPCASCSNEAWPGKTGKEAWFRYKLHYARKGYADAEATLKEADREVAKAEFSLNEAITEAGA